MEIELTNNRLLYFELKVHNPEQLRAISQVINNFGVSYDIRLMDHDGNLQLIRTQCIMRVVVSPEEILLLDPPKEEVERKSRIPAPLSDRRRPTVLEDGRE